MVAITARGSITFVTTSSLLQWDDWQGWDWPIRGVSLAIVLLHLAVRFETRWEINSVWPEELEAVVVNSALLLGAGASRSNTCSLFSLWSYESCHITAEEQRLDLHSLEPLGTHRYWEKQRVPESIDRVHNGTWQRERVLQSSSDPWGLISLTFSVKSDVSTWDLKLQRLKSSIQQLVRNLSPWTSRQFIAWYINCPCPPSSTVQFGKISGTKQSCQSWQWYQNNYPTFWPPSFGGPKGWS